MGRCMAHIYSVNFKNTIELQYIRLNPLVPIDAYLRHLLECG